MLLASLAATVGLVMQVGSAPSKPNDLTHSKVVVCDSEGFLAAAQEAERSRVSKRIDETIFARMSSEPNTIVLDARSSEHWKQLRIRGSINLPYTDFSASALERLIPDKNTRILIYCRNNLMDTRPPIAISGENPQASQTSAVPPSVSVQYPDEFDPPQIPKEFRAGLNIPTYITLFIYGYTNVWELSSAVDPNRSSIQFEGSQAP